MTAFKSFEEYLEEKRTNNNSAEGIFVYKENKSNIIPNNNEGIKRKNKPKVISFNLLVVIYCFIILSVAFFISSLSGNNTPGGDNYLSKEGNPIYWGVDSSNVLRFSSEELNEEETSKSFGSFYEEDGVDTPLDEWKDVISIVVKDKITPVGKMSFSELRNCELMDLENLDTSKITDMSYMFSMCKDLTEINVSSFDTSQVTNMGYMFDYCRALKELDLTNFNTSNVREMEFMFCCCYQLTYIDVSGFDTSKVEDMASVFSCCSRLKKIDVSSWNTSNVKVMFGMFNQCYGLKELDLTNFDTSQVTNMCFMFYECSGLETLDLSNFDMTNVTDKDDMFVGTNLTDESTNLCTK